MPTRPYAILEAPATLGLATDGVEGLPGTARLTDKGEEMFVLAKKLLEQGDASGNPVHLGAQSALP